MTGLFARTTRALAVAACLAFAGAAHAACIDLDKFKEMAANAGLSIRYAASVKVGDVAMPAYFAVNGDGVWIGYAVYRDALACVFAAGRRWTEQGKIPPADLRPGG